MLDALDDIATSEALKSDRAVWDSNAASAAEIFRPLRNELRGTLTEGGKRLQNVFDGTGIIANERLGAFIYGTFANPADQWLGFESFDPELNEYQPVKVWNETVSRRVLTSAGPSYSNFYAQTPELFMDMPAIGTAIFSSEVRAANAGFIDMCRPISQCWFDVDAEGTPNAMYRRWCLSAANAVKAYGGPDGKNASDKLRDMANDPKRSREKVELLHVVRPNEDMDSRRMDWRGKPFVSRYIEFEEKHEMKRGGFEEFPFHCPRWAVASGERMGRGHPGENAYGDGQTVQQMSKSNLMSAEWQAKGLWLMPDEGVIQSARIRPGGMVFGGMNAQAKEVVKNSMLGGNVPLTEEQINSVRNAIKEAFFWSMLLMDPQNRTGIADAETYERQQMRMQLMAPYVSRIITEFLDPWARRRFNMLSRLKLLPPPPRELQGKPLQVAFTSPLAKAQRAMEASGVMRTWGFIESQAAINPGIMDLWDGDQAVRIVNDANGSPARVLRAPDVVAALREQRQQREAMAQNVQLAQAGASAARDGASAVAQLRSQPQGQAA